MSRCVERNNGVYSGHEMYSYDIIFLGTTRTHTCMPVTWPGVISYYFTTYFATFLLLTKHACAMARRYFVTDCYQSANRQQRLYLRIQRRPGLP